MARLNSFPIRQYRGTTAQHANYTGPSGELTVDTTKNTVVVQDGQTAGGHPMARDDQVVHLESDESITGTKTFRVPPHVVGNIQISNSDSIDIQTSSTKGTTPYSADEFSINLMDASYSLGEDTDATKTIASTTMGYYNDGTIQAMIKAYKPELLDETNASLTVVYPSSGDPYATAPSTRENPDDTEIVTVDYFTDKLETIEVEIENAKTIATYTEGTGITISDNEIGIDTTWLAAQMPDSSGNTGIATSAIRLATARTINGTAFDGTTNIVTSYWGTARAVTIQDAEGLNTSESVSVDGAQAIQLKLPETIKANLIGTIEGSVESAEVLATGQHIILTGSVTGQTTIPFDGSEAVTITTALSDTSVNEGSYGTLHYETVTQWDESSQTEVETQELADYALENGLEFNIPYLHIGSDGRIISAQNQPCYLSLPIYLPVHIDSEDGIYTAIPSGYSTMVIDFLGLDAQSLVESNSGGLFLVFHEIGSSDASNDIQIEISSIDPIDCTGISNKAVQVTLVDSTGAFPGTSTVMVKFSGIIRE